MTPADKRFGLILVLLLTFAPFAFAQEDEHAIDFNRWVGREPKDLPTLLKNFQQVCERRYLPAIEKKKKPYDVAEQWTRDHCKCIGRFFKAKDDVLYVQVVNMELRDAFRALPPLPAELAIYLEEFEGVRNACELNPRHVSQTELDARADAEEAARAKKNKMRPGGGSSKKPKLPYRPQKSPQSEEPGARE